MNTMRALRFGKYGPPTVLSTEELPMPTLEPGEALVEVHAAAINPSDVKNVGGHFKASLPRVPGRDYAGVVVAGDGRRAKRSGEAEQDRGSHATGRTHSISSSTLLPFPRSRRGSRWRKRPLSEFHTSPRGRH
jgi:NADPH:quinone reductase-like Zn-dependent oxidoreductase